MVNKIKFSMIQSISLGMLAFAFSTTANAAREVTVDEIHQYTKEGLPDANIQQRQVPSVDDGYYYDYEYKKTSDGISFDAYQSYGYSKDWSEHVNTSPKVVKLLEVEGGVDAGISLGCSGLDLAQEAQFKFDADEFMDALKNYATTQMAVEALAQIYATPLISTVMDGIKSMNNFVAEFSQATCDMQTVQNRATEIQRERFYQCIEDKQLGSYPEDSSLVQKECGPEEITKQLREFQCSVSQRASTSDSLGEILSDTFGGPNPLTEGEFLSYFIPDVKFRVNGGKTEGDYAEAKKPLDEVKDISYTSAYNFIAGFFSETEASIAGAGIKSNDLTEQILFKLDEYKNNMLRYGDAAVYTDIDPNNNETYTTTKINTIRDDHFKPNSRLAYRTNKSATGYEDFIIGPIDGSSTNSAIAKSNLKGDKSEEFLKLGDKCFSKVYLSGNKYKWGKVASNTQAILSIDDLTASDAATFSDAMIERVSLCKAAETVNFRMLKEYSDLSTILASSYVKAVATQASVDAAALIAETVNSKLTFAITNSESKLLKTCQETPGFLSQDAKKTAPVPGGNCSSISSGQLQTGHAYSSCEEYAKQNQLSEEKIEGLKATIADNKSKLELLREEAKQADMDFQRELDIFKLKNNR